MKYLKEYNSSKEPEDVKHLIEELIRDFLEDNNIYRVNSSSVEFNGISYIIRNKLGFYGLQSTNFGIYMHNCEDNKMTLSIMSSAMKLVDQINKILKMAGIYKKVEIINRVRSWRQVDKQDRIDFIEIVTPLYLDESIFT